MASEAASQPVQFHHPQLNDIYPSIKISPSIPRSLKHAQLEEKLHALQTKYGGRFHLERAGESVEERPIYLVTLGQGPRKIFMWSQMHGDEPTATNALLDIFNYLLSRRDDPFVQEILQGATIYALPMLNPDGAERYHRRNAQGLDINRDARDLASPEGRVLKSVRDRFKPEFGFNLHDQNGRRTVGNTNKIVAIALLVPPLNENENDTPATIEAKKIASLLYQSLSPYIYGHIARYDASFMPRAFGENMQLWGTKTVLIEAGGWYDDDPSFLVKIKFIAVLEACHAIATGAYQTANPALYDGLARNDKELFDLMLRDAMILDGTRATPFKGDIGINFTETVQEGEVIHHGTITDIGDMDMFAAKETIDASDFLALPGLIGLPPGAAHVALPDEKLQNTYAKKGFTTLLVEHGPAAEPSLQETIGKLQPAGLRLNIGFVSRMDELAKLPRTEQATYLGNVLSDGVLALIQAGRGDKALHPLTHRIAHWLRRNEIAAEDIAAAHGWPYYIARQEFQIAKIRAEKLGLYDRGRIRIGDFADLALYRMRNHDITGIRDSDLAYLLVNGRVIYAGGAFNDCTRCGRVLTR